MSIPPFAGDPPGTAATTFPVNDRTWFATMKAAERKEQRAEDELRHYEVLGAGLAVFCVSFWEAIRDAEPATEVRFTREEALRLLEAAVQGR